MKPTTVTSVGQEIPALTTAPVRLEDIQTVMNVMDDVNPVHIDTELVERLGLRGLVNQGPANLAYVVNMLLRWAGHPAAIRRLAFRFHSISCPGDELTARARVIDVDADDPRRLTCDFSLERTDGATVVSGTANVELLEQEAGSAG